jgi:predicted acetyltransferase
MGFELISPSVRFHASWLRSRAEFGDESMDGASVGRAAAAGLELDDLEGFAQWIELLLAGADPTAEQPPGRVPATSLWVVEGERHIGSVQLRHTLNPFLLDRGGHIGYSIRPSARRRGAATFGLRGTLERAARLGLPRVLVTCDDDNEASARTIERCGGVLEDVRTGSECSAWRRYWIPLT